MYVVTPHTYRAEAVEWALLAASDDNRHELDWRSVVRSDRAYFDILSDLWSRGRAVCIVEHDVVVHEDALDELAACPNDWCGFPYQYGDTLTYGLGCTKFSADLIVRNPDALQRVGVMSDDRHPARHWCRLDAWLTCVLEGNGETRCEHETVVKHLGSGNAHGCIPTN